MSQSVHHQIGTWKNQFLVGVLLRKTQSSAALGRAGRLLGAPVTAFRFSETTKLRCGVCMALSPDDEEQWQLEGERLILSAAVAARASPEQVSIEWKVGRVVVTIDGNAYVAAEEEGEVDAHDDGIILDLDKSDEKGEKEEAVGKKAVFGFEDGEDSRRGGVDVTLIARAINAALDADGEV